jgi:predicted permease
MLAMLRNLWFRVTSLGRRHQLDAELTEEMNYHRELLADEARRRGVPDAEARRQAAVRLGNSAVIRERSREWWSVPPLEAMSRDVRYAARFLRRSPVFTTVAVLSIALGVGANAAVFTIVDRVFFRPPGGVSDPDAIRRLYLHAEAPGRPPYTSGLLDWEEYYAVDSLRVFQSVAGFRYPSPVKLRAGFDAPTADRSLVTWRYFSLLGVRAALGRLLLPEDDQDGAPPVIVLSHSYWRRAFGSDSGVIGRVMTLGSQQGVVIGVAQAGFTGLHIEPADLWMPVAPVLSQTQHFGGEWRTGRNTKSVNTVVRLQENVSEGLAASEVTRRIQALPSNARFMPDGRYSSELGSLIQARGPARRDAGIEIAMRLAAAALLVLLAACANVGSLLLARGLARERELAVRLAIGIGRGRLLGQLLVESLLICALGAAAALMIAQLGGRFLRTLVMPDVAWTSSPVDGRIVVLTLATTLGVGVIATLLPAWRASRTEVGHALKTGMQSGTSGHRLRSTLLAFQLAFSLMLLVGAGLFTRSLMRATRFDVGFDARQAVMVSMSFPQGLQSAPNLNAILTDAADRLRRVEGVRDVALTVGIPFSAIYFDRLAILERDISEEQKGQNWFLFPATGAGMRALGVRAVRGRLLNDTDLRGSTPVVVVSEGLAKKLWPGEDAVGKRLKVGADSMPYREVVGVVRDMITVQLTRSGEAQFFVHPDQLGWESRYFLLRVDGDADEAALRIRSALTGWRTDYSTLTVRPLGLRIDEQMRPWRLGAVVFAGFGFIALALAAIGVFGIVSFVVTRRTAEFGIRAALGATRGRLAGLVLGSTVAFAAVGLAMGVVASLAASRWLKDLLFHTSARDTATIVAASLLLLLTTVLAALAPMRRATRVDPVTALRSE